MFNCSNYTSHCYDTVVEFEFMDGINLAKERLERVLGNSKITLDLMWAGME